MKIPLEISYRNVPKTEDIDVLVHKKCAKLKRVCSYITSCRIAIEKPQKHQRIGNPYRVRLNITVPPGHELVVKNGASKGEMHEELAFVIRKVFNSASRQLKKLTEKQRGEIKSHLTKEAQALTEESFYE